MELVEDNTTTYKDRFTHPGGPPIHTKRVSRWDKKLQDILPNIPSHIPPDLDEKYWDALAVRIRYEELQYAIGAHRLGLDTGRDRSPSPPKQYDQNQQVITREMRRDEKLKTERLYVVDRAIEIYPEFRIPAELAKPSGKRHRKVFFPKDKPDTNFIGLIIGPRGNNQKELEKQTGARICIRGKDPKKMGKLSNLPGDDENEESHVLITADTQESLDMAYDKIMNLIYGSSNAINLIKQTQLRALAKYNGTFREDKVYEVEEAYDSGVKCAICGELSHATIDCPLKNKKDNDLFKKYDPIFDQFYERVKPYFV
ncbi:branchpoint-bridging protein, putative [Entamoeba invadens IP1]|uniref:Branchpoint-bridging protein n=1 Tax=Entamoeba invadens IP1 TaxID=370355 RepID=A0A0A1TY28_ENTIV|nr:branchpoint-bridging protein, putative [Entamoeba invadens IP1]ELP83416.1 branchpoint-bridging protein, putative [Entamoeba invadens IP1]|eukprot:XP_004182762.1 branchpoint-bridging protein, putative [Entamoeba invadens IP1]